MEIIKSPHDVRRTFATNLHYAGYDHKTIQRLMGHESLEQTEKYIQALPQSINDDLEVLSSPDKWNRV